MCYFLFINFREANICKKCWPLMVFAVKVIDRALRGNASTVLVFILPQTFILELI